MEVCSIERISKLLSYGDFKLVPGKAIASFIKKVLKIDDMNAEEKKCEED